MHTTKVIVCTCYFKHNHEITCCTFKIKEEENVYLIVIFVQGSYITFYSLRKSSDSAWATGLLFFFFFFKGLKDPLRIRQVTFPLALLWTMTNGREHLASCQRREIFIWRFHWMTFPLLKVWIQWKKTSIFLQTATLLQKENPQSRSIDLHHEYIYLLCHCFVKLF